MPARSEGTDDIDDAQDTPSVARLYDYCLGGYHNFAVDRELAARLLALAPETPAIMRANRAFLRRVIGWLAAQGITQFLDIGSGIPTIGNVHEVALQQHADARVVYVDVDAVAVRYSLAILRGNAQVTAIQADARTPQAILRHPAVVRLLDFSKPLAISLFAVLQFVPDDDQALRLVATLREALPSGGYLALSHVAREAMAEPIHTGGEQVYAQTATPARARSHQEIARFFEELSLVEPGLVYVPLWRPAGPDDLFLDQPERSLNVGGVGYKP